jgi:hypothetical protein
MVGAPIAMADDISNDLDASIDATAEVMPLNVGGANGTTNLYVSPTNGDGKNGCNLTGSTIVTLSLSSSDTAVATVSPSSVTFTSCDDTKVVTVTPVAQGATTISAKETANTTGDSFNLAPVTFTVNVSAPTPANTAPTVSVTGVTGGASYSKGSVPAAVCSAVDTEDGNSEFPAMLSAVTGPYASDGIGSQTASCSYTDGGGLTAAASETYSIVDPSAPGIDYTLTPATPDGSNGWYHSDVALTWSVTEDESPDSLEKTGCVDQVITSDQVATTYTCSATSAGGSAGPVTVEIKRDATAPAIIHDVEGTEGTNGWYVSPVTATFTASDVTSGLAVPATAEVSSAAEGEDVAINSPQFADNAGNTSSVTAGPFKIDLTDPTAAFESTLDGSYYYGQVPNAPTCTASDALSGPAGCAVTGYSTAVGTHTLTATAMDNAGRTGIATLEYEVLPWTRSGFYQPVDMGGVLNTVKGGSTVPLKFEVFAGTTELTSTSAVKSFVQTKVACESGATADEIEVTSTGGTSLRYDSTGGQFIQNWQTPKSAGSCYRVTMTTQDGLSISANFKLK